MWIYWNKFIVDGANSHPSEMVKVLENVMSFLKGLRLRYPLRRGHKYYQEEESLTFCDGQWGALTSAPSSSSGTSAWLPIATHLQLSVTLAGERAGVFGETT